MKTHLVIPTNNRFSNRVKIYMLKPKIGPIARYGLGLQRKAPIGFAASSIPLAEQYRLIEEAYAKKNAPKPPAAPLKTLTSRG